MIPTNFYFKTHFEKLSNGKLDRKLLEKFMDFSNIHLPPIESSPSTENFSLLKNIKDIINSELQCDITDENDFFSLGGKSMSALIITTNLNVMFQKQYDVDLELTPQLIYQCKTIKELYCGILKIYYNNLSSINEKLPDKPIASVFPLITTEYIADHDRFVQYVADDIQTVSFNFEAVNKIANYYNRKYNITILTCASHSIFFENIYNFVQEVTNEYQLGLIFTRSINNKNSHFIPAVLSIDRHNNKINLFISDSVGFDKPSRSQLESSYYSFIDNNYAAKKYKLNIYVDNTAFRQSDFYSCSIDALSYLCNVLRIEHFHNRIIDSITPLTTGFINGTFSSPPEAFKGYQFSVRDGSFQKELGLPSENKESLEKSSSLYSTFNFFTTNVDIDKGLKTTKKVKTLREIYKENTQLYLFRPFALRRHDFLTEDTPSSYPPIKRFINSYYYEKGERYLQIVRSNGG